MVPSSPTQMTSCGRAAPFHLCCKFFTQRCCPAPSGPTLPSWGSSSRASLLHFQFYLFTPMTLLWFYRRISPSGQFSHLILCSRVAPDRNSTRQNPKVSGLGPGAVGLTPRWRSSCLRTNSSPWASTWGRETLRRRTGVHVFQPWKTSCGLGVSATSPLEVGRSSSAPWPWHVSGTLPPLSTCHRG